MALTPPLTAVACILVRGRTPFNWLGHMPLLNWSVTQLLDVRGVTEIVCVVPAEHRLQATKLLAASPGIKLVNLPPRLTTDAEAEAWLCSAQGPAATADILVRVRPTAPFLPASKIEQCLTAVRRGKCVVCLPARSATVLHEGRAKVLPEMVDSVKVMRVRGVAGDLKTIPVSPVEALDAEHHEQFVLAAALVDGDRI